MTIYWDVFMHSAVLRILISKTVVNIQLTKPILSHGGFVASVSMEVDRI